MNTSNAYRVNVKLYFDPRTQLDQERLIPIFHRWIQTQEIQGDLLIDVADYKHVPQGPGVMLIAHHANYAIDAGDGALGLLYAQKRPDEGTFEQRLEAAVGRTLHAAQLLEREVPGLRFASDRWSIRIQDRLLAPNTPETFNAIKPKVEALIRGIYPEAAIQFSPDGDPKAGFGIGVTTSATPSLDLLRQRLETISLPMAAVA